MLHNNEERLPSGSGVVVATERGDGSPGFVTPVGGRACFLKSMLSGVSRGTGMRSLLLILTLFSTSPAFAWGVLGHQTAAYEAEALLSPTARREIQRLLAIEGSDNLASVALWADRMKNVLPEGPRHTVQLPLNRDRYDPDAPYCRHKRLCLVKALEQYMEVLDDRKRSDEERLRALKFVVHFVPEVHQPTHATRGKGRQWIIFEGKAWTINRLWQTILLRRQERNPERLAKLIMEDKSALAQAMQAPLGNPGQWAEESRDVSRDFIYKGPFGVPFHSGETREEAVELPPGYAEKATPIINQRLRLAGVRLAAVLNQVFDAAPLAVPPQ
jgi:hypothetical protein